MEAIRLIESGTPRGNYMARNRKSGATGAYQFMPRYWGWYAASAGYPNADIRDPRIQDAVATYHFIRLFKKYQDWDLVAIAWHGGEGMIPHYRQGNYHASDKYIDRMRAYMSEAVIDANAAKAASADRYTGAARAAGLKVGNQIDQIGRYYTETMTTNDIVRLVVDRQADLLERLLAGSEEEEEPVDMKGTLRANLTNMLAAISNGIAGGQRINVGAQVKVPEVPEVEPPKENE